MESIQAKHQKEERELLSRITQKKKNATKKTRKGVNDECDSLQRDLQEKQHAELDAQTSDTLLEGVNSLDPRGDGGVVNGSPASQGEAASTNHKTAVDAEAPISDRESSKPQPQERTKKPNRQKARLARRAAEQEAATAQAAAEAVKLPDLREQEMKAMASEMSKLNLKEIFIRPDGHCLYSAVASILPNQQVKKSGPHAEPYQNVRYATANFISEHPDDFVAFLEEPLADYTRKIKDTAEWGGQLELQAIAGAYGVEIKVLQASGRVESVESEANRRYTMEALWLAYYRHSFGLGEHYNALKKVN